MEREQDKSHVLFSSCHGLDPEPNGALAGGGYTGALISLQPEPGLKSEKKAERGFPLLYLLSTFPLPTQCGKKPAIFNSLVLGEGVKENLESRPYVKVANFHPTLFLLYVLCNDQL